MLNIARDRPVVLLQGSVNVPCEAEGCDSKKKWTRAVRDARGKLTHLCVACLRKLDAERMLQSEE